MNAAVVGEQVAGGKPSGAARELNVKLLFSKNLQHVANRIHATQNVDEIILEVSADICRVFNSDRLTIYVVAEDAHSIVSKVKNRAEFVS